MVQIKLPRIFLEIGLLSVGFSLLIGGLCTLSGSDEPSERRSRDGHPGKKNMSVMPLRSREGLHSIDARAGDRERVARIAGHIRPERETSVYASVSGKIITLNVAEGAHISEGDLVLTVDAPAVRAQQDAAILEGKRRATQFSRLESVFSSGFVSKSQLDEARLSTATAQARVTELQHIIDGYDIRSPVTGTVTRIPVWQGEDLRLGDEVIRLEADETLSFVASLPKTMSQLVKIGDRYQIGSSHTSVYGYASRIRPDKVHGSMRDEVSFVIQKPLAGMHAGGLSTLFLPVLRKVDVIWLPEDAIHNWKGSPFIFSVCHGVIVTRHVVLGEQIGDWVEIIAGVTEGDEILIAKKGANIAPGEVLFPSTEVLNLYKFEKWLHGFQRTLSRDQG